MLAARTAASTRRAGSTYPLCCETLQDVDDAVVNDYVDGPLQRGDARHRELETGVREAVGKIILGGGAHFAWTGSVQSKTRRRETLVLA